MTENIPNTAFVIFSSGAFGGAEKRFTNLFLYLRNKYPGKFYYIINPHMHGHIKRIFTGLDETNIHIINPAKLAEPTGENKKDDSPIRYNDIIPDPFEVDRKTGILRKYYWYFKNKSKQKGIFRQIEKIRREENIKVFIGIFAGGLPLVFYKEENIPGIKIIFSDMDSWFSDVMSDMKKLWYRKYYSFNYILEHADKIDFLSPYIAEGVKNLGINIPPHNISIAPCSFIDYSKCIIGSKNSIEIAFASRLEPDKNPLLYLEAAREVLNDFPFVKFHLLGEGSLVNEINQYISDNNLSGNVNFTFHKDPPKIFSETLIFVSLQSGTNYPSQSVLEAMACGNAVVASDKGDTGLFIDKSNGILVQLNKNSVSSAIKKLLVNIHETKIMGLKAAKTVIENHTIEKVSDYYTGLIRSVDKTNEHGVQS